MLVCRRSVATTRDNEKKSDGVCAYRNITSSYPQDFNVFLKDGIKQKGKSDRKNTSQKRRWSGIKGFKIRSHAGLTNESEYTEGLCDEELKMKCKVSTTNKLQR